jgi:hypothetical protein
MNEGLMIAIIWLLFLAFGSFVVIRSWELNRLKENQRERDAKAQVEEFRSFLQQEFKKLRGELADWKRVGREE